MLLTGLITSSLWWCIFFCLEHSHPRTYTYRLWLLNAGNNCWNSSNHSPHRGSILRKSQCSSVEISIPKRWIDDSLATMLVLIRQPFHKLHSPYHRLSILSDFIVHSFCPSVKPNEVWRFQVHFSIKAGAGKGSLLQLHFKFQFPSSIQSTTSNISLFQQ